MPITSFECRQASRGRRGESVSEPAVANGGDGGSAEGSRQGRGGEEGCEGRGEGEDVGGEELERWGGEEGRTRRRGEGEGEVGQEGGDLSVC